MRTLGSVSSAAVSSTYPLSPLGITYGPMLLNFQIEGHPVGDGELPPQADLRIASPGYFETIGLPLIRGRLFKEQDEDGNLVLATPTLEGLKMHSKVALLESNAWTLPTLVGTTLYIRDRKTILALDLR